VQFSLLPAGLLRNSTTLLGARLSLLTPLTARAVACGEEGQRHREIVLTGHDKKLARIIKLPASSVVLVLAACLALSACVSSGVSKGGKPISGGVVTFANQTGDTFNWLLPLPSPTGLNTYDQDVEHALWRPLYFAGLGAKPVIDEKSSLAFPPVWSDNDSTVSITLKPGLKWSDGLPVTTRDVEFFFNLYSANEASIAYYVAGELPNNIKSIDYVNSQTFVLHLTHSFSQQWYDNNQLTIIVPMPQQTWDRESSAGAVGNYDMTVAGARKVFTYLTEQSESLSTYASNPIWKVVDGPWLLTSFSPTTYRTVLTANSKFTGPYKPHLHQVIIENFPSATSEVSALRSGTVDYGWIPIEDYKGLKGYFESRGYTVAPWVASETQWAVLSYSSPVYGPLFKQLYIRQALQHLVNEQVYMTATLYNVGQYTYGPVPNLPGSPYVSPEETTDPDPYSIRAARSLLEAHGWKENASGVMACVSAGTGAGHCGAGIAAGRTLVIPLSYSSGFDELTAQVEAYETAAASAGVAIDLRAESTNTMESQDGVCPQSPPCNWGMELYSVYYWSFGDPGVEPTGEELFYTGAYSAYGYSSPTANNLIEDTETRTGLSYLYAYENYISRQVAGVWWPTEDSQISVVKDSLRGWLPQQVFVNPRWEQWYLVS
jgi:peptide/nickel transport system substrate-binding protein